MHREAIALLFFPSLSWASLGCRRSLPPRWRRAGPGLCSLICPLKRVGIKTPIDSQSSKQTRRGRAVRDGGRAPGLPESLNSVCVWPVRLSGHGAASASPTSPLWVIQHLQIGLVASFCVVGFCVDNAIAAAEMLRSELPEEMQKPSSGASVWF